MSDDRTEAATHARQLWIWLRYFVTARGVKRRCDHCGRLKHLNDAWHGYGSSDRVWHSECMAYRHWRSKASERLEVLAAVVPAFGVTKADAVALMGIGVSPEHMDHTVLRSAEDIHVDNLCFRVFYDLQNATRSGSMEPRL